MSEKRVFKKDYLGELKVLAEGAGRTDLVEFCDKEIEKLANRKVAQTKNQKDNEVIKEVCRIFSRTDLPIISNGHFGHAWLWNVMPLGVEIEVDLDNKKLKLIENCVEE